MNHDVLEMKFIKIILIIVCKSNKIPIDIGLFIKKIIDLVIVIIFIVIIFISTSSLFKI